MRASFHVRCSIVRPTGRALCSHHTFDWRYRNMENLPPTQSTAKTHMPDVTVDEFLTPPFQPVVVLRALGPYGRMLRLEPAISMAPDPEFLVRLLTGYASHQALIRHEAINHFKNLENLIRGKHKVSRTTMQGMASRMGLPMEFLEKRAGSAVDGPLMPDLLTAFQAVEGLSMQVTSGALNREVPCPCCGGNLLDDVDAWWPKQVPGMRPAEYHFAERLLIALLGACGLERFAALFIKDVEHALENLDALASPERHPIGNWLWEAQVAMSCNSLAEFAVAMQLRGCKVLHGRLKKWSAGQDVMPLEAGRAIAEACGRPKSGLRRLMAARVIALVTDFVAATWPTASPSVGRKEVQEVVHARLMQLGDNLQLASVAIAGETLPHSLFSGNAGAS